MTNETTHHAAGPKVYDSAVDTWIAAMLLMTPVVAAVIGLYAWWIGRPGDAAIMFAAGAFTLLVTLAFTLPCRYTILDDALSVRCGLLFYQVPFDAIVSIEPTSTWLSGPALSMQRVAVKTSKRKIIVSPKDREGFIETLSRQCDSLADRH